MADAIRRIQARERVLKLTGAGPSGTGFELPPPAWLRALCLAAFAATLAQIFLLEPPRLAQQVADATWDKLVHAFAFGGLAALLWVGVGYRWPAANVLVIAAIGALDEVHQIFTPPRTPDPFDAVADAAGALLATLALQCLASLRSPNRARPDPGRHGGIA